MAPCHPDTGALVDPSLLQQDQGLEQGATVTPQAAVDQDRRLQQDRRLDVVEARFAAQRPALEAEVRAANRELAAAIAASDGDTPQVQAAVDHFHAAMGDLQKATITHVFEMRSVLTPAQAEVFDAAVVEALHDDAG